MISKQTRYLMQSCSATHNTEVIGRRCWKNEELIIHLPSQQHCAGKQKHRKKPETEDNHMQMLQPLTLRSRVERLRNDFNYMNLYQQLKLSSETIQNLEMTAKR